MLSLFVYLQCFAPGCLEIFPSLNIEQRQTLYCTHLKAAQEALIQRRYAEVKKVKVRKIKKNIKNETDLKVFEEFSSNGIINVFVIPGDVLVVPSFSSPTHDCPVDYIHIRNQKCPLARCKETKSKLRQLAKNEAPLCIHTILIHAIKHSSTNTAGPSSSTPTAGPSLSTTTAGPSSSSASGATSSTAPVVKKKVKNPKINRDLTTKAVMEKISSNFPTMTQLESSGFSHESRQYLDQVLANKTLQQTMKECSRKNCSSCHKSRLENWPFKPKQAFLLSLGHIVQIEIPVKLCRRCRRIFYPGNMLFNYLLFCHQLLDGMKNHYNR